MDRFWGPPQPPPPPAQVGQTPTHSSLLLPSYRQHRSWEERGRTAGGEATHRLLLWIGSKVELSFLSPCPIQQVNICWVVGLALTYGTLCEVL